MIHSLFDSAFDRAFDRAAIATPGWQGLLQLEFTQQQTRTALSRSQMQAPLKVQRPFYPEGEGVCHVVMLNTAGGVVGGDRLSTAVHLQPATHALLTTATAGKIYRSNGKAVQQTTHIQIEAGACLEWLPQETIIFDQADYRQTMRVDLGENALWLGWDITRLGRTARGEKFLSGSWRSQTEIWQGDRLLWVDPQWVEGGSEMLSSQHGLANCPVVGSFAIVGRSLSAAWVEQARSLWTASQVAVPLAPSSELEPTTSADPLFNATPLSQTGVTRLISGVLCRYRGSSTLEARRWFTQVWHLLRPELLQRPGCNPRVW